MTLTIDTREPYDKMGETLIDLGIMDFEVEKLDHKADFDVDMADGESFRVQRKTVNDFVSSLDTLKDDLHELREHSDASALLIEGDWKLAGTNMGLRRGSKLEQAMEIKAFHNFVLSQQLRGTMFMRTTSLKETCLALAHAHEYFDGPVTPPSSGIDNPEVLLQYFPNIGQTTANKIIGEYGDVYSALSNIQSWEDVDGIGEKTKMGVIEWLQR